MNYKFNGLYNKRRFRETDVVEIVQTMAMITNWKFAAVKKHNFFDCRTSTAFCFKHQLGKRSVKNVSKFQTSYISIFYSIKKSHSDKKFYFIAKL